MKLAERLSIYHLTKSTQEWAIQVFSVNRNYWRGSGLLPPSRPIATPKPELRSRCDGLTSGPARLSNSSRPPRLGGIMLSQTDLAAYRRDGFILLPEILSPDEVEALRRVTDGFVRNSRTVAANDEIYALED